MCSFKILLKMSNLPNPPNQRKPTRFRASKKRARQQNKEPRARGLAEKKRPGHMSESGSREVSENGLPPWGSGKSSY